MCVCFVLKGLDSIPAQQGEGRGAPVVDGFFGADYLVLAASEHFNFILCHNMGTSQGKSG